MSRRRRVENDRVIALGVEQVADGSERRDLVNAGRREFNQFAHRFTIKLDLHSRST